ncbi:MAG TPA: UrcA family protein [Steroidobacteraceae bacterium]|nr:UrcA family protein [Steroidobacteraceae bacterium]
MNSSFPLNRRARIALACALGVFAVSIGSVSALAPGMPGFSAAASTDPSTSAGAKTLYRRIHQAAFLHCGGKAGIMSDYRIEASDCYRDAIANSVTEMGSPVLFTLHRSEVARLATR